jgi:hypothetical protein
MARSRGLGDVYKRQVYMYMYFLIMGLGVFETKY